MRTGRGAFQAKQTGGVKLSRQERVLHQKLLQGGRGTARRGV